jgi:hypothetical protein
MFVLACQPSKRRDPDSQEPVALAVFTRAGLEEPLQAGGVSGIRRALQKKKDGNGGMA